MPELPEVETIKRQLDEKLKGKKIKHVEILFAKIIKAPLDNFRQAVLNSKIKNVRRCAKLLIINLSNGYSLLIHLKMTGQLIFHPDTTTISHDKKHARVIFIFSDKSFLSFNDLRKFGYVKLLKTDKIKELLDKEYGPEPLDKNFTLSEFQKILAQKTKQKRKFSQKKISFRPNGRKIKQFLMDQKNIAGIGNIYADEICFFAGVKPTRTISSLSTMEIMRIYTGIKKILANAIKLRGSSVSNYLDSQGRAGEYHLRLNVYSRGNQPCKKCKVRIQKIKLAGRGTHFCPNCQK